MRKPKTSRRVTRAVNWRYALGETALIVAGIVIALHASESWERKTDRYAASNFLAELRVELAIDREQVSDGLDRYLKIESDDEQLLVILRSDQPYSDALDPYFGAVYGNKEFDLSVGAYESIKSFGLTLISKRAEFLNLVDYRLQLTRQNQIPVFQRALGQVDDLIAAIVAEQSS